MRIEIKTNSPVKDKDIRALYLIDAALRVSTPRMREYNLRFFYDKLIRGDYNTEISEILHRKST